jgi:Methyltransferase domain
VVLDLLLSGYIPRDVSILRAEIRFDHRVRSRMFMLRFIPPNSVGAELGVFTGLFSSHLAKHRNAARITFVDPWWTLFGEHYPDWGAYTDFGRLKTRAAYAASERRVLQHQMPNRFVEVTSSQDWLAGQPDESLDWVYLDSTHSYEGTKQELALLERKLKDRGLILGDDWQDDEGHPHHGVCVAVNEFLRHSDFKVIVCGRKAQWVLRKY